MAITTIPPTFYQIAFNADPNQNTIPAYWTDQSWRVQFPWTSSRGRQYELDAVETGEWRPVLANPDGALDPTNTASPYYPGVVPFRQARIQCKPGPNQLTPDQATAGEGTPYPAGITAPAQMGVSNDFGYTVSLPASGTAYQGGQVYQVALPNGATAFTTVLLVKPVPVVPGTTYSFSAQVRIPSGTSTATNATILWYNTAGANISAVSGASLTPTSGSSTWNTISVTGTAPTTAYSATLKIQIAGGSTSTTTTWQCDGLQLEQNPVPTPFQVPFTVSSNLLPGNLASGGYTNQSANGWWYPAAGSVAYATNLTAAPTGHTNAFAWTSPSGITNTSPLYAGGGSPGPVADILQVNAGTSYSVSFYALRAASADATLGITASIAWYNASAALISTSTGSQLTLSTGTWGRVSASGAAPAGAQWGRFSIAITTPAPTTATNTVYLTGGQAEAAGSPTAWRDAGPAYQVITPLIERWPQVWSELEGTYGQSDVIGDDVFVALSQYTLADPFTEEILALGPDFFYPLSDPSGSVSVADSAGKRIAAPIENSPYGAGSLTLGSSVTANTAGSAFLGAPGPVATLNNNPSQATAQEAQTCISLHKTTATPGPPVFNGSGPGPVTVLPWTRMIAFRCSTVPASGNFPTLWAVNAPSYGSDQSFYQLYVNPTSGKLSFQESGAAGTGPLYTSAASVCDGNWHQVAIVFTGGLTGAFNVYLDGALAFTDNNGGAGWQPPTSIATDTIGAFVVPGHNAYVLGWVGDLAHVAQFPTALTAAQISNLYSSWRTASSGESSGARIQRVLTWIGWSGPSAIDTGQTASMGPATDLAGATALDATNNITLTENGNWFVSSTGVLTFKARTARYNQTVPAFVFGENTAVGEWPIEDPFQFDYDPSHIANSVQVTRYGGSVSTAIDAASARRNFPRVYQRTINTTSVSEPLDAANYLISQYSKARLRVSALRLHVSAVPGLFLVCLQLELGTRIRVNRRPSGAPQISFDGFVEKIEWEWDPAGEVFVNLQCSPADLASYWQLAALHTTLRSQAASGQAQATINALPDSAYNKLSSSLPQGYQLTFDPGTSIAETMTLSPSGIPATNPGYTSAVLTFTSNFQFTHQANAVVCEPLPTGYTDPTTWDAASVLGAASCQVVSGGGSGTNTITVGPLGDAKANTLASDWATGDLLWVSPGTANFEGYNLLTPNQATAGEGVLPLAAGTAGSGVGITADVGTPTVTASGTAWQGANVWQTSCAGGVSTPTGLLYVLKVPATAGLAFTGSLYARSITTGANPVVHLYVKYLDANGNSLAEFDSSNTTLTGSPTASWTRITASGTAPAGAVWLQMGLVLTTAPGSAWNVQCDGLQAEQNGSASVFCVTPQVKSVAGTVPGYTSVVVTVNSNFINSHSAGDVVCDPLPPGTTSPTAAAAVGTSRIAY